LERLYLEWTLVEDEDQVKKHNGRRHILTTVAEPLVNRTVPVIKVV